METKKTKTEIRVSEGNTGDSQNSPMPGTFGKEKLKKPLIFGLMAIIFLCCMYLIFKPSASPEKEKQAGLNEVVPQATDTGMPADKGKAYEIELLEQKDQEKRNALMALSDYWGNQAQGDSNASGSLQEVQTGTLNSSIPPAENEQRLGNALNSYRTAQNTLGSFYSREPGNNSAMQKEIEQLREQLAEREDNARPANSLQNQLTLMEKSYQMAAKYLPQNAAGTVTHDAPNLESKPVTSTPGSKTAKEVIVSFVPDKNNTVSALQREISDSAFIAGLSGERNTAFHSGGTAKPASKPRNSVRACIHETQTVNVDGIVRLRMLEAARTPNYVIPKGTILSAVPVLSGGRLSLKVSSIELSGHIIPVDISVYDLDGQSGLNLPYSPEVSAAQGILANMGGTAGSNVTLNSSAGQQVTSDLTKSLVNGISGYFAKKVTSPKITLKAGHQLYLLSLK